MRERSRPPALFNRMWPTAASLLALIGGFAVINDDVRGFLERLIHGGATAEITSVTWQGQHAGWIVFQSLKDQSMEHGPLTIFAIAASVLVLFMLRT